jgi:hypothetical protein
MMGNDNERRLFLEEVFHDSGTPSQPHKDGRKERKERKERRRSFTHILPQGGIIPSRERNLVGRSTSLVEDGPAWGESLR